MPMNEKPGQAAIIVIAGPKAKAAGVRPPLPGPKKESDLPELPKADEECEYCDGEGCDQCEEDTTESDNEDMGMNPLMALKKLLMKEMD